MNFKSRIKTKVLGKKHGFVMWKQRTRDNFFSFFGYIPKERYKFLMEAERTTWQMKCKEIESKNLDRLIASIDSVNMVKIRLDTPHKFAWETGEGLDAPPLSVFRDNPPPHNWYVIQVKIDMSRIQRIYQELTLQQNGYEYRYLVESLLEDIRRNVDALIKMEFRL